MLRAIPFVAAALTMTGSFMLDKAGNYQLESISGNQGIHFFETKNEVKWRDRKRFYWHDVAQGFRTTQPGRVQTLADSSARIRLSDSHELLIAPNSLVEIDLKRRSLYLISGKIFINRISGSKKTPGQITINNQPFPEPKKGEESVVFLKESETQELKIIDASAIDTVAIEPPKPEPRAARTVVAKKTPMPKKVVSLVKPEAPSGPPPEAVNTPAVGEIPIPTEPSDWIKIAGVNLPLRSINILSDNLGKAEGLLFTLPGIDVSVQQRKERRRFRFDYAWNMLRSQTDESLVYLNAHDFSGAFIFQHWGLGASLLGRDILALEGSKLADYSYISPTVDLIYTFKTDTETKDIDAIAYFSPLLYAIPLSGQTMGMSGWRLRMQSHFLNKKLWRDYQVGPSVGLFYESTNFKYKVDSSEVIYKSTTFGINLGYSLKF